MDKITFILEGLDCANCARKIEERVNNIESVDSATLNFVTKKLVIETNRTNVDSVTSQTCDIVYKLEPHVKVIPEDDILSEKITKDESHSFNKTLLTKLALSMLLFFTAILFEFSSTVEFVLFGVSYVIIGYDVLLTAFKNILKGELFDENFLMSIATLGAFAIGEFSEGVAVMLFYQVGELFQDVAVNKSRKSITSLMDIRPDFANIEVNGVVTKVDPNTVNIDDVIVVKNGERIPLDGTIINGVSMLDTSALTGESVPRTVNVGDDVLSGSINKQNLLKIKVTKTFGESSVSKILDLVENATNKKAPTEQFITKFAKIYTPIVVMISVALAILPPLFIDTITFAESINRALVFLVVSCPCALVISIPLGFFGGIGSASKNGILIKGGNYLEALTNVDTIVFDKTGTLTKGVFEVVEIKPHSIITEDELLELTAYAESFSTHPIATSIVKKYSYEIDQSLISDYQELSGLGLVAKIQGKEVIAGNSKLMDNFNISYVKPETIGTTIHIAIDKAYSGYIIISDIIKSDSIEAIKELKKIGIKKTVMLTGDSFTVAEKVAKQLNVDEFYSELLPQNKVELLEELMNKSANKSKVAFVGDGINDAPVLARADIGVSMGGIGSDIAIEASDIVLMTDEPSKLVDSILISRKTKIVVWQNIAFAMGFKIFVLILGALGYATMWEAVFADVGVALLAILNAMRVMKYKK